MGKGDPPRLSRGGQGLFDWEKIKDDKYAGNYLGSSLRAATGRWVKNRDLEWFSKDTKKGDASIDKSAVQTEMDEIKRLEAEAFAEALGYSGPKRLTLLANQGVSKQELKRVITTEAEKDLVPEDTETAQITGVGFNRSMDPGASRRNTGMADIVDSHLNPAVICSRLGPSSASTQEIGSSSRAILEPRSDKAEDKQRKKEKKEKKKKKKHSKRDSRSPSLSSNDDKRRQRNARSRSREQERERDQRRHRSRSRDRSRYNNDDRYSRRRSRSRSPFRYRR